LIVCRIAFLVFSILFSFSQTLAAEDADSNIKWYIVDKTLSGDKIKLQSGSVVTYASLKAPDMKSFSKQIEDLGAESMEYNRLLVEGKNVRLEWGSQIRSDEGDYLAFVYLEDGTFVNHKVLKDGFAKLNVTAPNLEHAEELERVARGARSKRRGLWRHEPATPFEKIYYVGDKMKKTFHEPDCDLLHGKSPAHLKRFGSIVAAKAVDYRFCNMCKKGNNQRTELF
jgi:endonuclease YncB( thermonuclease family)